MTLCRRDSSAHSQCSRRAPRVPRWLRERQWRPMSRDEKVKTRDAIITSEIEQENFLDAFCIEKPTGFVTGCSRAKMILVFSSITQDYIGMFWATGWAIPFDSNRYERQTATAYRAPQSAHSRRGTARISPTPPRDRARICRMRWRRGRPARPAEAARGCRYVINDRGYTIEKRAKT